MLRATDGFTKQLEAAVRDLDAVVVTAVADANYQALDREAVQVLSEEAHQPKGRTTTYKLRQIRLERYRAIAQAMRLRLAEQTQAQDEGDRTEAVPSAPQTEASAK